MMIMSKTMRSSLTTEVSMKYHKTLNRNSVLRTRIKTLRDPRLSPQLKTNLTTHRVIADYRDHRILRVCLIYRESVATCRISSYIVYLRRGKGVNRVREMDIMEMMSILNIIWTQGIKRLIKWLLIELIHHMTIDQILIIIIKIIIIIIVLRPNQISNNLIGIIKIKTNNPSKQQVVIYHRQQLQSVRIYGIRVICRRDT